MSDLPSTHDWAAWATRYREDLLGSTLPFWLPRALDQEHGGFLLCRDRDGALVDDDKGIWQHGRFTWLLGKLHATVDPRPEWLTRTYCGSNPINARS